MRQACVFARITLVAALAARAAEGVPPLITEPDLYSYSVAVPEGWVYSYKQASEFGVAFVLFHEGSSFHHSTAVMYATEVCERECRGALRAEVDDVLRKAKAKSPKLLVESREPITTRSGAAAEVRVLSGASDPRQAREALAFIAHREVIVLLVLSTRDTRSWDKDFAAFETAVRGYQLTTCSAPDVLVGCRSQAAPAPLLFDASVAQANADEASPQRSTYSGPFFEHVGPFLADTMQRCFAAELESDVKFTLVFAVRGDGKLAERMARPETPETTCVLEKLEGARAPVPPKPYLRAIFDMTVTE
jgi:hypothetical protein